MFCDHIQQMVCCLHKPNIKELPNPHPGGLFTYIFTLYKQFYRIQSFLVLSSLVSTLCVSVFSLRYF